MTNQPRLLGCGHYITQPEELGGVCQICGRITCKLCIETCTDCGRKLCTEHQRWKENHRLVLCPHCTPTYIIKRIGRGLARILLGERTKWIKKKS